MIREEATVRTRRGRSAISLPPIARMMTALAAVLGLAGCSTYVGTSRPSDPAELSAPGWIGVPDVPYVAQREDHDCGVAALAMVLAHWKKVRGVEEVREACPPIPGRGSEVGTLRAFAKTKGLQAYLFDGEFKVFEDELARGRPVLVGMGKPTLGGFVSHFEVVVGYNPGRKLVMTLDPALGVRVNDEAGFREEWRLAEYLTLVIFHLEAK